MTQSIQQSIARNINLKCKATSCNNPRLNLSGYCRQHFKRANLYGSPLGKSLRQSEYRREYEDASALITKNLSHVATVTCLKFIQDWLDKASNGQACVKASEMARLAKGGVKPLDILLETSAIFLYSQRKPKHLPDDEQLSYQIGIAVLRLVAQHSYTNINGKKSYRKPSGTERKSIGEHLRQSLGLFLFNVTTAINKQEQDEYDFREKLWTPLDSSVRVDN
jgi:hypothetical protein